MKKYKVLAICGEAGSGKDYLLNTLLKDNDIKDSLHPVISCTTRPMRENEINGKDYYFISNEDFAQRVIDGRMLEAVVFNNWCYGASIDTLIEDKINIFVCNPAGIEALAENPAIILAIVRIKVSPKTRLLRQLNREKNPDVDEIIRRYAADKKDFTEFDASDIEVIEICNENDDQPIKTLKTLIRAFKGSIV